MSERFVDPIGPKSKGPTDKNGKEIVLQDYEAKELVGVQAGDLGHKLWICIDGAAVLRVRTPRIDLQGALEHAQSFNDARNDCLPENPNAWDKFPPCLRTGDRIGWWFEEDWAMEVKYSTNCLDESEERRQGESYARAYAKLRKCPPFQGVVVPAPDTENCTGNMDPEAFIVVMDLYPVEKCYCEATYIALRQLAANPNLHQVVKLTPVLRLKENKEANEENTRVRYQ